MIYLNAAQPVVIEEEIQFHLDAKELTIVYQGGNTFHAKNVRDISLGYDKGGKTVLIYSEDTLITVPTEFGTQEIEGVTTFSVTTGDIESITLDFGLTQADRGVRNKLTVEL